MKHSILKLSVLASVFALTVTSCSNDDSIRPTNTDDKPEVVSGNNVVLPSEVNSNLTLDASKIYALDDKLIINDGAKLTIPAGTNIIAKAGGAEVYIAALKGGQIDIQGTINNPVIMTSKDGNPGDWGGLTLVGDATTTAGIDAIAEVGNFVYGGTNDTDNSGSIKNLVIKGTGAQINADSQYNGISFYAVGSGTVVENIAVINGDDDGIEFFGGTVNVKNVYLENNSDDAIDWTEGWNGTIDNAYVLHNVAGFSTVVEGDKDNKNPKINNLTALSTVGGTALQFKKESGATITGLSLSGYDQNLDFKDGGALSNVKIEGVDADLSAAYDAPATVDITTAEWNFVRAQIKSFEILKGELSQDKTLDAAITYNLTGAYLVQSGATLTIPAGTKIIAENGGVDIYIAVLQGGKIDIQGTPSNPVVMSSIDGNPADWGGLTICGKATTTAGSNAVAEVGSFIYGGTNDTDNSGSIKNLVIRGTGAQINPDSQYNGVSLYAVGSGTVIENVAVINGDDDGIEFFGGTVSASNIYLENNSDDAVDWTEGWNGTITNTYVLHNVAGFSTAVEGDKDNKNPKLINFTAESTVGGTALQFKKESGATITNLFLGGYDQNLDFKDGGAVSNVQIEGADADVNATYEGTKVDISTWTWRNAELY